VTFDHGIRYELDGHVARVTIDRPNVLNAVDRAAHLELQRVWADIEASSEVRVVVLTGAGDRSFCVGADVSAAGVDKTGMEYWADLDPDGFGGLSLRESLDVPVIARVNGYALGGGMEMVLGCDIVVAADTARFGLTEPRIGRSTRSCLPPTWTTPCSAGWTTCSPAPRCRSRRSSRPCSAPRT
jgi:crotonobetainyl-CoA hydratase